MVFLSHPDLLCLLQVNCSLGFNIVSALSSVTGVILCIIDIAINAEDIYTDYYTHWGVTPGMAVSSMLLIFSFLEFCIACTTTHFGCRLACYSHDNVSAGGSSVGGKMPQRGWRREQSSCLPLLPRSGRSLTASSIPGPSCTPTTEPLVSIFSRCPWPYPVSL